MRIRRRLLRPGQSDADSIQTIEISDFGGLPRQIGERTGLPLAIARHGSRCKAQAAEAIAIRRRSMLWADPEVRRNEKRRELARAWNPGARS